MSKRKSGDRSPRADSAAKKKQSKAKPRKSDLIKGKLAANSEQNSEAQARRLANLRPFPKGVSGNPSGRPKHDLAAEIAEAIFAGNRDAIERAMAKKLRKGDARVFQTLAERAWGKPRKQVDVTGQMNVSVVIDI